MNGSRIRPLYFRADGTSNGSSAVVHGTFDEFRCCGMSYQTMTPIEPTERDLSKGIFAFPCGIGDCPDGKLRRQQFHNPDWKEVTLAEAVEIDHHHEDMGGREYPEYRYTEHPG